MTLGTRLIDELSRRGERGMYFDYAGYQQLRRVDTPIDLAAFLAEWNFPVPPRRARVDEVADALRSWQQQKHRKSRLVGLFAAITAQDLFVGLLTIAVWGAWRIFMPKYQTKPVEAESDENRRNMRDVPHD